MDATGRPGADGTVSLGITVAPAMRARLGQAGMSVTYPRNAIVAPCHAPPKPSGVDST